MRRIDVQDIREVFRRDDGVIEEPRSLIVAYESEDLLAEFTVRRNAAEERLRRGETESLTITEAHRIGRNSPCPCNSGLKFKKCCGVNHIRRTGLRGDRR